MFGLSQRNNSENAFTSSFLMVSSVNVKLRVSSDFSPDLSRSDSAAPRWGKPRTDLHMVLWSEFQVTRLHSAVQRVLLPRILSSFVMRRKIATKTRNFPVGRYECQSENRREDNNNKP